MTAESLWERLREEGLVEGARPEPQRAASPWYVRAMLGIAGWIGALFLIGFVGAAFAFIMEDAAFAALAGAACCAGASFLFRAFDGHDFAEQFGLVVSLVGQILLGVGVAQVASPSGAPFYLALAAIETVLALAIPHFLHRVLATGAAAVAVALGVNQLSLHGFAAPLLCAGLAWVWLEPARWAGDGRMWRPVGYGLVLGLLLVETFRLFGAGLLLGFGPEAKSWMASYGPLIGRGATALVLAWVALDLARREQASSGTSLAGPALGATLVVGLISLMAPGLASALVVLLLGFAAANRLLMALGILSLLGFVAHFYYSLHATLLEKSAIMAATGLLLLAAHFLLRRGPISSGAGEAADA